MGDHSLGPEDYRSIDRAADELLARGWRNRFSIGTAIEGWTSFVEAVEDGYTMSIYEYTNDCSVRRWAAEARPFLSSPVRQSLDTALKPIDERFRAATFEAPGTSADPGTEYWWEHRLPTLLVGELAEDVRSVEPDAGSRDQS